MDFFFWLLSYVVPFLAVLTVIVFVHEMGHYLVARWNGIAIQAFSIGFGPELIGFNDRHGTRWKLSAIPLGGYVRFVGDMNAASVPDEEFIKRAGPGLTDQLFVNKNVWQRIAVVVAGPVANIIFSLLVLYALLLGYGRYTLPPIVSWVAPWSPAMVAGLQPGDRIVSVDGFEVQGFEVFQRLVSTAPERTITIVLDRNGETLTLAATPDAAVSTDRFGNTQRTGRLGVTSNVTQEDVVLYRPDPIEAIGMTLEEVRFIIDRTAAFIGDFFVGRGDVRQLGGPVEIAKMSGEVATLGISALVGMAAYLSLNLGIFNLLPIPLLDGGHLVFYLAEALRGRPLPQRVQEIGFRLGFVAIMGLFLVVLTTVTIPHTLPSLLSAAMGRG
jgi:regulator of sigma E protease